MAKRRWNCLGVHAACTAIVGMTCLMAAAADEPVLTTAYGTGVHAYHAGDYQRSYDDLTAVIDGGASDPRAFYFRGLAALRLGRIDEADADFAAGAEREAAALGSWNVPRALERIQGEDRLRLERHRAKARVMLMQRRREAIVRRYTEVDAAQEGVLRRRRPEAVPAREVAPQAAEQPQPEAGEELPEPEPEAEEAPAADVPADDGPATTDTDSPFADEPAAGEEPMDEAVDEVADEEAAEESDADVGESDEEEESIPE